MTKGSWLGEKCDNILTFTPLRSVELSEEWQGIHDMSNQPSLHLLYFSTYSGIKNSLPYPKHMLRAHYISMSLATLFVSLFVNREPQQIFMGENKEYRANLVKARVHFPVRLLYIYWVGHPGGRYFRNFWVAMCHWDPGTLSLYQSSFKWILLPYTRLNSQNPPYPRVAVFQKLLRSQTQSSQNKTDLIFSYFWVAILGFPSLD